ncbi:hypothetical protein EZV62_022285 [Acer yangbiense]|uniref:BED-type domain-containing protein n=1 Tax=Acer yangbiense TaxID=1000413 RepID=A0A5C7HA81_9ROSI|nr:hypothetical protein EZV62_022285 [Acer yangbiense]
MIDMQLQELNSHFPETNTELLLCVACLSPRDQFYAFDKHKLIQLAQFYPRDYSPIKLLALEDQLENYIADICSIATATVERVFSAINIVKTDLRNRMGDEWLNDIVDLCEMSNRKDPAWNYAVKVERDGRKGYKYIRCIFCQKTITAGVYRMKEHISGVQDNVAPCASVTHKVRDEMKRYLGKSDNVKKMTQLSSQSKRGSSSGCMSQRAIRGPKDKSVMNIEHDEAELGGNKKQESEKEARD